MKINIVIGNHKADFKAPDEAGILRAVKAEAGRRAPFLLRAAISAMSDTAFAAQVVARANKESGRNDKAPQNAREFLDWARARGYATTVEE